MEPSDNEILLGPCGVVGSACGKWLWWVGGRTELWGGAWTEFCGGMGCICCGTATSCDGGTGGTFTSSESEWCEGSRHPATIAISMNYLVCAKI